MKLNAIIKVKKVEINETKEVKNNGNISTTNTAEHSAK